MSDRTIVRLLQKLFSAYGQAHDTARASVYVEYLADLPVEDVAEAVARACQTGGRFLPTISELRAYVAESRCELAPVEIAWTEVLRQVRLVGRYRVPRWSSPAVAEAVEAIGWQAICDATNQDVTRAHFARAYGATRRRALESEQVGRQLLGGGKRLELGGGQ